MFSEISATCAAPMSFAGDSKFAINCTSMATAVTRPEYPATSTQGLSAPVRELISNSIADSTKRGYASDLAHYEAWGGTIPSAPEIVASYLADCSVTYAVATMQRRLAAIAKAHRAVGAASPKS